MAVNRTIVREFFLRGTDNQISITLTENDVAISGAWTRLEIWIGSLEIERNVDGNGVALNTSTGVLTITPADLTEDLSSLVDGQEYDVLVRVVDSGNDDGAVFGGEDSDARLIFKVSTPP